METYIFIGIALLLFIMLFSWFIPLTLYMKALHSGINIGIDRLIGMRIRKVPTKLIVNNLISAHKAGIELSLDELEAHYLAGSNIPNVVKAMIAAKAGGLEISFEKASRADLSGIDILGKVLNELNQKRTGFID
ncbi:MAG: flotillin-like FloA family protein [Bacteroidales bacterium]|nr:flotillin-like FloA family protein [Bacteroidales bacterium]